MMYILPNLWIVAPYRRDQEKAWEKQTGHSTHCYTIDCHRNHGGPYAAIGQLLRQLVPQIQQQYPQLVARHATEILSIAPDLHFCVAPPSGTLTSLAVPQERTRFYASERTRRLAHGVVEALVDYVALAKIDSLELFFSGVNEADPLDQQVLAILLRRMHEQPVHIVLGTATDAPSEIIRLVLSSFAQMLIVSPLTKEERLTLCENVSPSWQQWLMQQPLAWRSEWELLKYLPLLQELVPPENSTLEQGLRSVLAQCSQEIVRGIAQVYIESDGCSENPIERIAYSLLDKAVRQRMHDERAASLEALGQRWCALGPIPYHYEHGSDQGNKGVQALGNAINYSFDMGYYDAALDYGLRGRNVADPDRQLEQYWNFTTKIITALLVLEHPEHAEKYCKEMRASTSAALIHIQLAYTSAMLYTRYYKDQRRDHMLAKEWIQIAIALTRNLRNVSKEEQAFMEVFNMNALALIEMNLGRPEYALQLIADGLAQMDRELGPDAHKLHRSVFLHNRGQVYAKMRNYSQALEAFSEVIAHDPYYSEYYFDRADVYQQLQRYEEALADYNTAILYSPPYLEAYYNRATVLSLMDQEDEALADYTYALELEPGHELATINRVGILYERGRYEEARADLLASLMFHNDSAQLFCMLGLVEMALQRPEQAYQAFMEALQLEPGLYEAWSNLAALEFERGNTEAAIQDLTQALELSDNAAVLYNRGLAYQKQQCWQQAIADYTRALVLEGADRQELLYQRTLCYLEEHQLDLARKDMAELTNMGAILSIEEIRRVAPMAHQGAPTSRRV